MIKLFLFLLVFFICPALLLADKQKNILIIHSYSQEYLWTKNQHEGFVQHLRHNFNEPLTISTEYLDTKRVTFTLEYQKKFIEYINMKYRELSPNLIYVTDDNAINFVLQNRNTLLFNAPVVFSGINNLDLEKRLDTNHFTGVYEIKDVQENINLLKIFSPQTKEIYFLGDETETYNAIEQDIKNKQVHFPNMKFHFIHAKKFTQVLSELQNLPNRSVVLLTTIGGFETDDRVNQTLQSSIDQLSNIKNIILMSMEDAYIQNKVIGGFVTDGKKQGDLAAKKARKILQNVPVENIQSTFSDANTYMFDRKALLEAQIFLPETIKKKSKILNEEASFYLRYEKAILNTFFIGLLLMLVFMALIYFISREKKQELLLNQRNLLKAQKVLRMNQRIIENIQKITHSIYWELDIETSKIFLVNTTNINLPLQNEKKISYDDFFNYLIYPSDFYLIKESMKETISSLKSATLEHRILLSDGSSVNVLNSFEYSERDNNMKMIIGIMKLVDAEKNDVNK
ncbi:hypothetical protein KJ942_03620 [bacterium]|nr:hypothetical protein [bacterium]MBU4024648.1 hypothetical protein [bacterium]MBU4059583.1 hypothetical protein [bacterium]